jgi:cysteine synthase
MLTLAADMRAKGQQGAILSLLCDAGERYLPTYHDAAWVERSFGTCADAKAQLQSLMG